jgi:hypothetical protein
MDEGDPSRGGYKNCPAGAIILYTSGGYPNVAVDGWVTDVPELPVEAMLVPVAASYVSVVWP